MTGCPDLRAAESAVRARLAYDPNGPASRYRKGWRLDAFRARIFGGLKGGYASQVLTKIRAQADLGDPDAHSALVNAGKASSADFRPRRGRSGFANTWSDETIALAVSDAIVYGRLTPYRNRVSETTSACGLVAQILQAEPFRLVMLTEAAVEKIWQRLGPGLPGSQDDVGGWR